MFTRLVLENTVYKRKCNKPFTKSNSRQTAHYADPAVRGSSNNTLLKQALCDDNLDKALDWLRHSESHNQFGQRQVRKIRSAEDRILIRVFSQVLTPIVQAATPKECTHLANRSASLDSLRIKEVIELFP